MTAERDRNHPSPTRADARPDDPHPDVMDLAGCEDVELEDGEAVSEDSGPESFLDRFVPPKPRAVRLRGE